MDLKFLSCSTLEQCNNCRCIVFRWQFSYFKYAHTYLLTYLLVVSKRVCKRIALMSWPLWWYHSVTMWWKLSLLLYIIAADGVLAVCTGCCVSRDDGGAEATWDRVGSTEECQRGRTVESPAGELRLIHGKMPFSADSSFNYLVGLDAGILFLQAWNCGPASQSSNALTLNSWNNSF